MKTRIKHSILLMILLYAFVPVFLSNAQSTEGKQSKKTKEEKKAEKEFVFARIDTLVRNQQFVFKAEFGSRSNEIFVVVDSGYAMVQNGNRNNLDGRVTQFKMDSNQKNRTIALTIMMRSELSTADIFLFIGESGAGTATIKSDFPGYFSFNGQVLDFENANIYDGGSIFIH